MKRRGFLQLLGIAPIAIKEALKPENLYQKAKDFHNASSPSKQVSSYIDGCMASSCAYVDTTHIRDVIAGERLSSGDFVSITNGKAYKTTDINSLSAGVCFNSCVKGKNTIVQL